MAGKIFINYRRGDDPGFAQALFARLEHAFPPEQLFMDVDNIKPGLDFVHVLERQVAECDVLISVIGKNWIDARDETGGRRLDNPDDFVRIEIESALAQNKRVIPALVGQASMPRADELPASMKPLARRNAVRLTHERFKADIDGLIAALRQALNDIEEARAFDAQFKRRRPMFKMLISFRRGGGEVKTGRIFDRLVAEYGAEVLLSYDPDQRRSRTVQEDIEDRPMSADERRQYLEEKLRKTDILLVIIGPNWLVKRRGITGIDVEYDVVRIEIETALRLGVPIIPVLIGDSEMPLHDQLPKSMKDFAFLSAAVVDFGEDFDAHMNWLIQSIDRLLEKRGKVSPRI